MSVDNTNEMIALALGVAGLVGVVFGIVRWAKPKLQQGEAVGAAILGREEVRDRSGAVIQPAVPGMVAQVATLATAVDRLADVNDRMNHVETEVSEMKGRLQTLEDARFERVVTRAESAQAWRAIAAVHENGHDDDPDPAA